MCIMDDDASNVWLINMLISVVCWYTVSQLPLRYCSKLHHVLLVHTVWLFVQAAFKNCLLDWKCAELYCSNHHLIFSITWIVYISFFCLPSLILFCYFLLAKVAVVGAKSILSSISQALYLHLLYEYSCIKL